MQFNYKGSGKSVEAGTRTAQAAVDFYATNRENSPDFTNLAKEAIKSRSNERRAAIAAEAQVAQTGLKAKTDVEFEKIDAKTQKAVRDIKKPAARMAGIVSAASTLGGVAVTSHLNKQAEAKWEAREAKRQANTAKLIAAYNKAKPPELELPPEPPEMEMPKLEPYETSDTKATPPSSGSGDTSKPTSKGTPGKIYSQTDVYNGLVKRGMSPEQARIGAAVMMGESKGDSAIDTVKSGLDPNKNNEFSVGLFQINTQAHMDKLTKRGLGIDSLRDGETNMDLAIEVFNEAGGSWEPWGAYTNGSYKNFL